MLDSMRFNGGEWGWQGRVRSRVSLRGTRPATGLGYVRIRNTLSVTHFWSETQFYQKVPETGIPWFSSFCQFGQKEGWNTALKTRHVLNGLTPPQWTNGPSVRIEAKSVPTLVHEHDQPESGTRTECHLGFSTCFKSAKIASEGSLWQA